jgi:hypothetical protein
MTFDGVEGSYRPFRRKITQAEVGLDHNTLAALEWQPVFHLIMAVGDGEESVERSRVMLTSLSRQVYQAWTLHLIAHYRDPDFTV